MTVDVVNPTGQVILVTIRISPPGQDIQTLIVERNGDNWIAQAVDPASGRSK